MDESTPKYPLRHVLVQRPIRPASQVPKVLRPEPRRYKKSKWDALYPYIEKLYIRDGRKLRDVMACMEQDHSFFASEQMYKKRLSRWGLMKGHRRVAKYVKGASFARPGEFIAITSKLSKVPESNDLDLMNLQIMTKIRDWTTSYFETGSIPEPTPPNFEVVHYGVKLAGELLSRGQGELAGRMIRKSFLFLSDVLLLDAPAIVWNLSELIFDIAGQQQRKLLELLINHLLGLTIAQHQRSHPLVEILWSIRTKGLGLEIADLQYMVKQSGMLNAKLVMLDHAHSQYLPLYTKLVWDNCSIRLPIQTISEAQERISKSISRSSSVLCNQGPNGDNSTTIKSNDASFRELSQLDLDDPVFAKDIMRYRLIGALSPTRTAVPGAVGGLSVNIPREHIQIAAAITFAASRANLERSDLASAETNIRQCIKLRQLSRETIEPRVVWALWVLEEVLRNQERFDEAELVRDNALDQAFKFVEDIPIYTV